MENPEDIGLEWQTFDLPNIPIYQTKLPQNIVDRLWGYVHKAKESFNSELAGNIDKSLLLVDEEDYFMNNVVGPVAQWYVDCIDSVPWIQNQNSNRSKSMVLNKFWVNFQNKHEFNPIHKHDGLFSFVVWMKIPTHHQEQYDLPISKNSNCPSASNFQFTYSDILGNHKSYSIQMGPHQEGWILVFPAQLLHQVYPFYNCDEQRISISGNICWN
jgi:hypothetical protein